MFDIMKYLEGTNPNRSITDGEVRWLYELGLQLPLGAEILELGLYLGRSACVLAYLAAIKKGHYTGIDHFNGRLDVGMGGDNGSEAEVKQNLYERGLLDVSTILVQSTETVSWDTPVDMLHVDACHFEPNISRDIGKYAPFVKKGGILAFDDYALSSTPQVKAAVNKYCGDGNWQDLGLADEMKCFRRL